MERTGQRERGTEGGIERKGWRERGREGDGEDRTEGERMGGKPRRL